MSARLPRQQIRPSLAELRTLPPEYDFDDEEAEDDEEDGPTFAPSASSSRTAPPVIETSRGDGRPKHSKHQGGRVAESDLHSTSSKHQRFDVRFSDEVGRDQDVNAGEDNAAEEETVTPLIGTIQERRPYSKSFETKRSDRAGQSRFAARRALDHDAGLIKPKEQAGPSQDPERTQAPAPDLEEWLDEDGHPMSAFRKNRLIKQGLRPPSVRPLPSTKTATTRTLSSAHTPSEQSASMAALMQSISHENESKIAAMSADDVEEELRELQDGLGSNLLELLKSRQAKSAAPKEVVAMGEDAEKYTKSMTHQNTEQTGEKDVLTSEDIRQKYFPNEPKTIPSALEWTYELASTTEKGEENSSRRLRFDFEGRRIDDENAPDLSQTHLAGLHHHGQDQHRPGYTTEELIHLARSTNPSQRVMSLQSLARIASRYTEKPPREGDQGRRPTENVDWKTSDHLMRSNVRGQACIVSSWYVENKQANVRSAALACIKACLSSMLGLNGATPFVETPRLASPNQSSDNSGEESSLDPSEGEGKAKMPDIHAEELQLALIPGIIGSLQLREASTYELSTALDNLLILSQSSRKGCNVIIEHKDLLRESFSRYVLEQPWPSRTAHSPIAMRFLQLLNTLIVSSREAAITFVEQNWVEPLLRFISIPPWSIIDTTEQVNVWQHLNLVLQIFISLGRYGIASDTYGRSHALFNDIQQWILRLDNQSIKDPQALPVALAALENVMRLLTVWTVCATDAHRTHNHHDITWSQVSEWWECAIATIIWLDERSEIDQESSANEAHFDRICTQMEAIRLMSAWIEGAHINRKDDINVISSHIDRVVRAASTSLQFIKQSIQLQLDELTNSTHTANVSSTKGHIDAIARLCRATSASVRFSRLDVAKDQSDALLSQAEAAAHVLLKQLTWTVLRSAEIEQKGIAGQQRVISEFVHETLCALQDRSRTVKTDEWLRLALLFPQGNETEAQNVVLKRLSEDLGSDSNKSIQTLSPFIVELLRYEASSARAPLDATTASLKASGTLFLSCQQADKKLDTDPLSGAPLWKSANSGLPLRSDWPFVALDDLLHSGNCAALNRPDVLEQSWDANELEIVIASLELGVTLWKQTSEDEQGTLPTTRLSALPSADEVIMAIMKVYMLEEDQASAVHSRATGKITGRDIYRDSRVNLLLSNLFDLANTLSDATNGGTDVEAVHDRHDSLEEVALRQFGSALSFYQFYTSLVGLYDAISYGDELFGRALLAATQMRYPADYRRLIWSDYAHCLATLTTSVEYAPGGLSSYIATIEQDDAVIRGMTMALLGGYVRKERNTLLYRVAIYHLGALLWSAELASPSTDKNGVQQRAQRLAKTLFGGDRAVNSGDASLQYLELVRADLLSWTDAATSDALGEAECQRRKEWVDQASQS